MSMQYCAAEETQRLHGIVLDWQKRAQLYHLAAVQVLKHQSTYVLVGIPKTLEKVQLHVQPTCCNT